MPERIILYTSWEGEERFRKGESFIGYAETTRAHMREFSVSKEYISNSGGHIKIIEPESDADFGLTRSAL